MAITRLTLNRKGIKEILRSNEVRRDLETRARRIAAAAGPGFAVDSEIGRNRARASVFADTNQARRAEATSRALSRSLDAGR